MCEKQWKADGYEDDKERIVRGLYRADLQTGYDVPLEAKKLELVGLTNEPAKIARAVLAGDPPNLIGSRIQDPRWGREKFHAPLFDFDIHARWKKSSTKGHHHLLIDEFVNEKEYIKILKAMADSGLQQAGFANQIEKYGQTFLRWNTTKDEE